MSRPRSASRIPAGSATAEESRTAAAAERVHINELNTLPRPAGMRQIVHRPDAGNRIDQVCRLGHRQAERHRRHPVTQRGPHAAAGHAGEPRTAAGRTSSARRGTAWRILRSDPSASAGCRYISSPSAVMNTPCSVSTWSIQLKSSADWAIIFTRLRRRQQLASQLDHRWKIDCDPTELVADISRVEAIETGLQSLGQGHHGGLRVVEEVSAGLPVVAERAHRHVLTTGEAELREVELDASRPVGWPSGHR